MAHAIAVAMSERAESAALAGRHADIVDREIAHMQFVPRHVLGRGKLRFVPMLPATRLEIVGIQIDELAAHAVDRKRVVSGKSVSVRVDRGGRRILNKKT